MLSNESRKVLLSPRIYCGVWAITLLLTFTTSFLLSTPSHAGELTGFVALDGRLFASDRQFEHQRLNNGPTLVVEPEYYHVSDDDSHIFTFRPFARLDPYDGKRRHFDIRQADWLYSQDEWEIRAGISKEFWGVIESNHLVDIINQTDSVEDVDGEDKLGQPMLQAALLKEWGTLRFYYLPYFRETTFMGVNGRLRGGTPVESDKATYDSSAKRWNPDFAIRYEHAIGDWDIGLAHFSGTSREATMLSNVNSDGANIFTPHYELIDQTSIDLQLTKEAWLWKFEALTRSGHGDRFFASSFGAEYSFYNVKESGADISFLAEYHRDERDINAPLTFLDDDIFIGSRIALNDVDDTTFLGGVMFDRNTKTRFYSMEAATRIGNRWKIELDLRIYSHIGDSQAESGLTKDDHAQIRFARYF